VARAARHVLLTSCPHTECVLISLMTLLIASPWIAGSVWLWLLRPRDGAALPSMAELALRRF
jgi:hypothetical protein